MARRSSPIRSVSSEPIRVVVIEPRAILGVGVREILDEAAGIEVLASVDTPAEAMSMVGREAPDVLLVDAAFPEWNASEATRRLLQSAPDSALVVMGGPDDDASIVSAVEVGAVAHVAEMAEPADLVRAIRRAADGEDPLKDELIGRPDLVERIVDGLRESIIAEDPPTNPLSTRELEILVCVAAGSGNREIADQLGLSEQTVKNHMSSIFHKLGVPNRTHAVTHATRHGWLSLAEVPSGPAVSNGRS